MIKTCDEIRAGLSALTLTLKWNQDWRVIRALEDEILTHPMARLGERSVCTDKDADTMGEEELQRYFYALVQQMPEDIGKKMDDALLTWGMAWSAGIKCPVEARGMASPDAFGRWCYQVQENRELLSSFAMVIVALLRGKRWDHAMQEGREVIGGEAWYVSFCTVCPGQRECKKPGRVLGWQAVSADTDRR